MLQATPRFAQRAQVAKPLTLHACSTDYHLSEWFDL